MATDTKQEEYSPMMWSLKEYWLCNLKPLILFYLLSWLFLAYNLLKTKHGIMNLKTVI